MISYHMHLDVCDAIRWPKKRLKGMFRHETENRSMTADEVIDELTLQLLHGRKVIPVGQCDNFDYSGGGCLGHEEVEYV